MLYTATPPSQRGSAAARAMCVPVMMADCSDFTVEDGENRLYEHVLGRFSTARLAGVALSPGFPASLSRRHTRPLWLPMRWSSGVIRSAAGRGPVLSQRRVTAAETSGYNAEVFV